jgi:hypothetical protein
MKEHLSGMERAIDREFRRLTEKVFGPGEPEPTPEPPQEAPPRLAARIAVVKGKANETGFVLERARTNIGRLREITDSSLRIVRRNDIVFEEGADEANGTVSRTHAHILREEAGYRIIDDGSEYGTRIFREGRSIDVPMGGTRGERLRGGDEIYLGRACLVFEDSGTGREA